MKKCKYCGSDYGVYTKIRGFQDYSFDGEPEGYEIDQLTESKSVYCRKCHKRLGTTKMFEGNKI